MHSPPPILSEFDLIERFFKVKNATSPSLSLGIGDDCALINPPPGEEIAITSDMLVQDTHFFSNANPEQLGRKALAVNLSDLAAMGAKPLGFTLAIALPKVDPSWLAQFSQGLFAVANAFDCPLIGGDTTAGPLTIAITAMGCIPQGKAIRRSGAKVGDEIWVSGHLGDARLTLAALRHEIDLTSNDLKTIENRMHQPTPRVELGMRLREFATAAIDVSDGLLGDLKHVLKQSQVHADVLLGQLPKSATLQQQSVALQNQFAACGGDDYELCFTAPPSCKNDLLKLSQEIHLPLTNIGKITAMTSNSSPLRILNSQGNALNAAEAELLQKSFDHFPT